MRLSMHLLGSPRVVSPDGPGRAVRGHKVWALLAYLVLADAPPTRQHLAALLFGEAGDPLASLRWNLTQLRRLLGDPHAVGGDPVRLSLPAGAVVDVDVVRHGAWPEALRLPGLGRELLDGVNVAAGPAFDMWLLMQRRHLMAATEAVLREAALARLAAGHARGAVEPAGRLVALNPLEETSQTLLVRCLAAAGDGVEAARQAARCTDLFRRELGVSPSPALAAAARTVTATPTGGPVTRRAAARAQLAAGRAAIGAGVVDAGLDCLRRAYAEAHAAADEALQAEALAALGAALVHAVRGHDDEGSSVLHEALVLARRAGLPGLAATACRELGYVEFLRARYDRALLWAGRAYETAADDRERARIRCLTGSVYTDTAHHVRAVAELSAAARASESCGDQRQAAYTLSMLGRVHLLRGSLDAAAEALRQSTEMAQAESWTSLLPWPEALHGDVDLAAGDVDAAAERYEYAFALGCQLGDPCWEAVAGRGLGLVAAARGDVPAAVERLLDARERGRRLPDSYLWAEAYVLDALCGLAVAEGLPSTGGWVRELTVIAERGGMRDLIAHAHGYAAALSAKPP